MSKRQLNIDDKRQLVYSAVLRYAPEAIPLRQRVLDGVVLSGLVGSSASQPYTIGAISRSLKAGSSTIAVRQEVVQETIARLHSEGRVVHTTYRKKHAYYLAEATSQEVTAASNETERLFEASARRTLRDTESFIPRDVAERVFRRFVIECFARSGRIIAQSVCTGGATDALARSVDARAAFREATAGQTLTADQQESMEARCISFLTSHDAIDERLRFVLAQNYYFAQLLELEAQHFNPLAEQAFDGCVFYLDANVLLPALLPSDVDEELFLEVVGIARRAGIELRVTRATLTELQKVAARQIPEFRKILTVIPAIIVEHTADPILRAFLRAREAKPQLSPNEYLESLGSFEDKLRGWNLTFDERDTKDLIRDRDTSREERVLHEEAVRVRGYPKPPPVLMHDVAHYLLIADERQSNPKTWFLTRDRSLAPAVLRLDADAIPFCFPQLAFLQSISPFVQTPSEEYSFVDVFSSLVSDQFRYPGTVFDVGELSVLAEFHSDVLATPPEQLLLALDFVKSRTLHGRPYTEADIPRVSLELKKFLASDRESQLAAMRGEQERLKNVAAEERRLRGTVEEQLQEARTREQTLEHELTELHDSVEEIRASADASQRHLTGEVEAQRRELASMRRRNRAIVASVAVAAAAVVWLFADTILEGINRTHPGLRPYLRTELIALKLVATTVFSIPALSFIRQELWPSERKTVVATVVIAFALWASGLLGHELVGSLADLFGVASFLALVLLLLRGTSVEATETEK